MRTAFTIVSSLHHDGGFATPQGTRARRPSWFDSGTSRIRAMSHFTHRPTRRGFLAAGCCIASAARVNAQRGSGRAASGGPGPIDVHAHFFPERFITAVNTQGGPPGVSFDLSNAAAPLFLIGGNRIPLDTTYWDLDLRLRRMDAQ